MKFIKHVTVGFVFILLMVGCIPEQRVVWSPDGQQAAVLGREDDLQTLYLCDSKGTLSAKLLDNVHRVAWCPDSQGLILVRSRVMDGWGELESLIASEEKSGLVLAATAALAAYQQSGDLEYLSNRGFEDSYKCSIGLYLKAHQPKFFEALKLEEEKPLTAVVNLVQLACVREQKVEIGKVVAASTLSIWDIRVSPQNQAVVFTCGDDDTTAPTAALYLASFDGDSSVVQIARNVSWYPDWTADGQYVVYAACAHAVHNNDLQLGAIMRSRVIDDSGQIVSEISKRDELAGVVLNQFNRIRCTPDGEIIFSAFEINLPASSGDMPEHMNLFSIHPSRQFIVSRVVPRFVESYFGDTSWWFEFSPDYKHIALVDREDRVGIVTLASGEAINAGSMKTKGLPCWRTSDELTFVGGEEDEEKKPQVMMYSFLEKDKLHVLSTNWPSALVESLSD
jgi:hypothetical protein